MAKSEKNNVKAQSHYRLFIAGFLAIWVLISVVVFYYSEIKISLFKTSDNEVEYIDIEEDTDEIVDGVHVRTGFVQAPGMQEVINNCTNCHSAKLVTQNRMNKSGWTATIRWMQKTQNLWELGENEELIINYLAKNYGPIQKGRREGLKDIEWYPLK